LNTTNGLESREETFFARKPGAQLHEAEQPRKPSQEGNVTC